MQKRYFPLSSLRKDVEGPTPSDSFFTYLRYVESVKDRRNLFDDKPKVCYNHRALFGHRWQSQKPEVFMKSLKNTYWWYKVKPIHRKKFYELVYAGKHDALRQIFHTVDGLLLTVIFSSSELILDYTLTDKIMVRGISNAVMNHDVFLKSLKFLRKSFRKSMILNQRFSCPRNLRFLMPVLNWIKKIKDESNLWWFRLAMLTQTRASGLPTGIIIKESVKKFVDVTSMESVRTWDKNHFKDRLSRSILDNIPSFDPTKLKSRLSISTTACVHSSVLKGGKARVARDLLVSKTPVYLVDLETGVDTNTLIEPSSIGEYLFHLSLKSCRDFPKENIMKVNLSTVREPSKARSVTSSNFFHSQALQPYSHMLLDILSRFDQFKVGISSSRDGWHVYKSLSYDQRVSRLLALSTDMETATDYFNWKLIKDILKVWNSILRIPKWYGELVIKLLTSPRYIYLEGKLISITKRGGLMGDPVIKAVLTSVSLPLLQISDLLFGVKGDDLVAFHTSLLVLENLIYYYNSIDVKLAPLDTFISNEVFSYAEEWCRIPRGSFDTWANIQSTKSFGRTMYLDYPRLRLILDVTKDRDDNQSRPQGKIDALGKDMEYSKNTSYAYFAMASLFQDVLLNLTSRGSAIVYLPRGICGSGKPFIYNGMNALCFEDKRNKLEAYVSIINYTYSQIIRHQPLEFSFGVAKLFQRKHSDLDTDSFVSLDLLTEFKGKEVIVDSKKTEWTSALYKCKDILAHESQILGKILSLFHEDWLLGLSPTEIPEEIIDFYSLETKFPKNLRTNSVLNFFKMWHERDWVFNTRNQSWYPKELVAELDLRSKMIVNLPINPMSKTHVALPHNVVKQQQLLDWLLSSTNVLDPPRELIDDDLVILNKVSSIPRDLKSLVIVTDDLKLMKKIKFYSLRLDLYRLPVRVWVSNQFDESTILSMVKHPAQLEVDTAQVERYLSDEINLLELDTIEVIRDLKFSDNYSSRYSVYEVNLIDSMHEYLV